MDGWLISEEDLLQTIRYNRYREKRKLPFRKEGAKTIILKEQNVPRKRIAEYKTCKQYMIESQEKGTLV